MPRTLRSGRRRPAAPPTPFPLRVACVECNADQMTWDVTDRGFRMGLSPEIPRVLERHAGPLVGSLLARQLGLR